MKTRENTIAINKADFQKIGYELINTISDFFDEIPKKPITTSKTPKELQQLLEHSALPENGLEAEKLIANASKLLINNSLFNGHPKFFGYITSSAAPIGALADLLAAAINPNVGAQILSPIATEIEKQTIQWLAEFIGVSPNYGGVLVSGGNMANFTAFLAARTAKAPKDIKENGLLNTSKQLLIYCSKSTHTWIDKAAILFGHGTKSVRWIPTDTSNKMNISILEQTLKEDLKKGLQPFLVVGTAGDVSTGVVDNLEAISAICKTYNLWFHIDGAYGVPAAIIPELKKMFQGIKEADSIALDPHKWLYSPLEAGCTLVKNPKHLIDTYSSHPEYYNFSLTEEGGSLNYFEYGLQNSRGFRALKVWLALQQLGKNGYIKLLREDIELSKYFYTLAKEHPELEAITQNLSIATFRYVPKNFKENNTYLNTLNETLLDALQKGGEMFLSNAIIEGKYSLRTCIVNFRTTQKDIKECIEIIVKEGRKTHLKLQTNKH
ncbi:aminotransferase class V-fold PLP-dependent enzyme [Lacinutrix sp. C3R15]|uniref:pyridoxal phosphate-dependent decarboxylase family protein n=1 Tax=Flavobacteriaceae TaxID=49546 RepID=UPI001C0A1C43|nr:MULTISPECIES: aminotransferase class V-fold PLP-dependent enzyme [Flavobacteriaceae]MBU2939904.1 aminotransferase class V-fold PLP-dependent enzyme [Lacinutrix sp. C3R15]MDO6623220.1 aminotransferase class V-fold PLP-dependent enzyme [Oceanihabitans sp. 1_MG-2023]